MSLKVAIDADLKQALLDGDKEKTTVLRGLKATILDAEVATSSRESGLQDTEIEKLIAKEVKKRRESITLYEQNSRPELAEAEKAEILVLEVYLPTQLTEEELSEIIDQAIASTGAESAKDMGRVITEVKSQAGNSADGATVARLVKSKLT